MNIIKYLFICICILACKGVVAQENEIHFTNSPYSNILSISEIGEETILSLNIGSTHHSLSQDFKLEFYQIISFDPVQIELLKSIDSESRYTTIFCEFNIEADSWFVIQQNEAEPDLYNYKLIKLNTQYEEIATYYYSSYIPIGGIESFVIDNKLILVGYLNPGEDLVAEWDLLGDSLLYFEAKEYFLGPFHKFSIINDTNRERVLAYTRDGIFYFDEALENQQQLNSDLKFNGSGEIKINGDYLFIHGCIRQNLISNIRYTSFAVVDLTSDNILFSDTFGLENIDNYPFTYSPISVKENHVLIGGWNYFYGTHSFFEDRTYYLAKYNSEFNLEWEKTLGGDRAYSMNHVKILNNNYSVYTGIYYPGILNWYYTFFGVLDEFGNALTSSKDIGIDRKYIVENPGSKELNIFSSNLDQMNIKLYNLQGMLVKFENLNFGDNAINVCELNTGQYYYQIEGDGRICQVGSWVKVD